MSKSKLSEYKKQLLIEAQQICDSEDRSTENMIQFMQNYAECSRDDIIDFIRQEWNCSEDSYSLFFRMNSNELRMAKKIVGN